MLAALAVDGFEFGNVLFIGGGAMEVGIVIVEIEETLSLTRVKGSNDGSD